MRVGAKTAASCYNVVVEHTQHAEMHAIGVVVIGKGKGVVTVEPTVVGMAARSGAVNNHAVHDRSVCVGNVVETEHFKRLQLVDAVFRQVGHTFGGGQNTGAEQAEPEKVFSLHGWVFDVNVNNVANLSVYTTKKQMLFFK